MSKFFEEEEEVKLKDSGEWKKLLNLDNRYNVPKGDPQSPQELIRHTIATNSIYTKAKEHILKAQMKQVGYGLDKYPEPLTASTWSEIETIDHIIDESIDKLHYLVMLRIKLEERAKNEGIKVHSEVELEKKSHSLSLNMSFDKDISKEQLLYDFKRAVEQIWETISHEEEE